MGSSEMTAGPGRGGIHGSASGGRLYHVFLSHSSADKPAVEQLARRIREEAKLEPFLDQWHLVPGAPWQPALE
jgi:hypothetical protein